MKNRPADGLNELRVGNATEATSVDDPATTPDCAAKEARKRRQVLKIREPWSHLHGIPHRVSRIAARTLEGLCDR